MWKKRTEKKVNSNKRKTIQKSNQQRREKHQIRRIKNHSN